MVSKTIPMKIQLEQHEPHKKTGGTHMPHAEEGETVTGPLVALVVFLLNDANII